MTLGSGEQVDTARNELGRYCEIVEVFRPLSQPRAVAWSLAEGQPAVLSRYWAPDLAAAIRRHVRARDVDLVEFEQLYMAPYVVQVAGVPTVLREHNAEYVLWERRQSLARGPRRMVLGLLAAEVRRVERAMLSRFDRVVAVTPQDAAYLSALDPTAAVESIPSGVDTEFFTPNPSVLERPSTLTIVGSFRWAPKQHNVRVLATEVFPHIAALHPQAELWVVGSGIPKRLEAALEQVPGVHVTGPVADVRPFLARSSVVLNYVQIGGGIALKVLEAMAMGRPVLTNSLGSEGIIAEPGRHLLAVNDNAAFVRSAARLLADGALRRRLGDQAVELIRREYAWDVLANRFSSLYETLMDGRLRATAPRGRQG